MQTVVVGLSGGVDSSVAAYLLKQQGYNIIGLFMLNWEETDENGNCTAEQDFEDVKRVADKIGIPYYTVNYAKEYKERVFEYFLDEYKKGYTPNPDVMCNKEIKFGPFLEHALRLGADYIATGHYCKRVDRNGKAYLYKSFDKNKDQTYFLNQLNQNQLNKTLFPLADIDKTEVRKIASKLGLVTAEKKDSTGICFIGERNFRQFLKNYLPAQKGKIKDLDGNIIGEHDGVMYYTLGQRRGLNIGGKSGTEGGRWFVVDKEVKNNLLIVSQKDESPLYSKALISYSINWIPKMPEKTEFKCYAKFRYRQPEQEVNVKIESDKVLVSFVKPQRAVTPGQFVVFYDDKACLGGGIIEEVIK